MTPMVQSIQRDNSAVVYIEYKSFFKKLGAFTLSELKDKYENDANRNFELRLRKKYDEEERKKKEEEEEKILQEEMAKGGKAAKKPEKKEVKKEAKLSKAELAQLELEKQRQEELEKQKLEEERLKKLEIEKNFDSDKALKELGGKLVEFGNVPENSSTPINYFIRTQTTANTTRG
jgi:hypothetical protein